jgi:hypothetical protein
LRFAAFMVVATVTASILITSPATADETPAPQPTVSVEPTADEPTPQSTTSEDPDDPVIGEPAPEPTVTPAGPIVLPSDSVIGEDGAASASGYGAAWDVTINGVKVHMSLPVQALAAGSQGHSWTFGPSTLILSAGAKGHLYMINKHTKKVIWSAGDYPGKNKILQWQKDGNLVLYNQAVKPGWASGTYKKCKVDKPGDYPYQKVALGLQDDGNMVIYCYHQNGNKMVYKAL